MKMRIMQTDEIRGLLYEFWIVLPEGHRVLLKALPVALSAAHERLPAMLLTATAITASMGSPTGFKDAREFAAWIGLVPRQTGTGVRIRQLGISKRGDAYLRTLLMHGARSIVRSDLSTTWPWLAELLKRRPYSVVVAAVANKLARTIWAMLAKSKGWQPLAWQAASV